MHEQSKTISLSFSNTYAVYSGHNCSVTVVRFGVLHAVCMSQIKETVPSDLVNLAN